MQDVTVNDASDAEVWSRLVAGQADLFSVIYGRHAESVYGYCFRRTGSWSAAEDLTSIVFLEAWRRRADIRFGDEGSLRPWLFGVANNAIRNRARAVRRHRAALQRLPAAMVADDATVEVDRRLDDEAKMRRVLAVLEQLSPHHQEVLALTVWAGLDLAGAAVALGVPVGTVKSRLSRARAALAALASPPTDAAPVAGTRPEGANR